MRERVQAAMERVDALSARERGLVFLAILSTLYVAWSQVILEPLAAERERIASEVQRTRSQIQDIHARIGELATRSQEDPDASNRARVTALREELRNPEPSLRALTRQLVPPEQMSDLLLTMLTRAEGLELVKLEGLGTSPALDPAGDTGEAGSPMLFRHGLRIEFEGGYRASIRYLSALEELPWQFLWESVELELGDHRRTRVSITVYSLSLEQGWMEV